MLNRRFLDHAFPRNNDIPEWTESLHGQHADES